MAKSVELNNGDSSAVCLRLLLILVSNSWFVENLIAFFTYSFSSLAIAKDENIIIRPIMYLALSYDHRIIDGKEAVSFLKTVKECLEEPRRLFLDL